MPDCDGKHVAQGLCWKHYRRYLRHGDPSVNLTNKGEHAACLTEGCGGKHYAHGHCQPCRNRQIYEERKAAGLCVHCGNENDRLPVLLCSWCASKKATHDRNRRKRARGGTNTSSKPKNAK